MSALTAHFRILVYQIGIIFGKSSCKEDVCIKESLLLLEIYIALQSKLENNG